MYMAGEKEEKEVNEEEEKEEREEGEARAEQETGPNLDYKIENVVATVTLDIKEKIDLNVIARKYADVDYNPEWFPGIVMWIEKIPHAPIFSGLSIVLAENDFHLCLGEPYNSVLVLGRGVDGV